MDSSGIIYLIRHCATLNDEANYPILLGQKHDLGLSDAGRKQAAALADFLSSKNIDAIYASPQARAVQTARIVNARVEGAVTFCTSLKEADMGNWEGMTYASILDNDADNFDAYLRDPGTYGYPGGENLSQVCRRALNFIEKLAEIHPDQRIVIITHKYVNRAVLAHFMAQPLNRAREIDQDPGCVNVIRVFRGVLELQSVNYTGNFELADEEDEQCKSPSATHATLE